MDSHPRPHSLTIRISEADKRILEEYCAKTGMNRTEAISRGIGKLKAEDAATPDEVEAIREVRQEIVTVQPRTLHLLQSP